MSRIHWTSSQEIITDNEVSVGNLYPLPVKVFGEQMDVTVLASDIQIGAIELKDALTDVRQNVTLDSTQNAAFVQSESLASESTLSSFSTQNSTDLLAIETNQTDGTQSARTLDTSGIGITSTSVASKQGLDVAIIAGAGGPEDTDDGTLASSQIGVISLGLNYGFTGIDWERINSTNNRLHVTNIDELTLTGEVYGTVTVTTTATLIAATNTSRKWISIQNYGNKDLYVGFDNALTTANGTFISSGQNLVIEKVSSTIYGITPSGTTDVRYMEV